jgi:hypothetical protein
LRLRLVDFDEGLAGSRSGRTFLDLDERLARALFFEN